MVPYVSMCSRAAFPKSCAVGGAATNSWVSSMRAKWRMFGFSRSSNIPPRDPRVIFSKPMARATSLSPPSIHCFASMSAVEPVEQLLLTLKTGIPVRPSS